MAGGRAQSINESKVLSGLLVAEVPTQGAPKLCCLGKLLCSELVALLSINRGSQQHFQSILPTVHNQHVPLAKISFVFKRRYAKEERTKITSLAQNSVIYVFWLTLQQQRF